MNLYADASFSTASVLLYEYIGKTHEKSEENAYGKIEQSAQYRT